MLEDNAKLALLYLDAFAATGERRHAEVVAGVVEFLTGVLALSGAPLFAGSQDADERYFRLPAEGRAGADSGPADRRDRLRRVERARRARVTARLASARASRAGGAGARHS